MALPHFLDDELLSILFEDKKEEMVELFTQMGLFPSIRLNDKKASFSLHEEIRNLLLAHARNENLLQSEAPALHFKLASLFEKRFDSGKNPSFLPEQLYHQFMGDDDTDLSVQEDVLKAANLLDVVRLFESEKQYEKADKFLEEITDIQPKNEKILIILIDLLFKKKEYQKMEITCGTYIEINRINYDVWINLSRAFFYQKKFTEMESACCEAILIDAESYRALTNLGISLNNQGKCVESEDALRRSIVKNHNNTIAWVNLGETLRVQGKNIEAEKAYREAIKIDEKYNFAWKGLGVSLFNQRKIPEAQEAFREAIKIKNEDDFSWHYIGKCFFIKKILSVLLRQKKHIMKQLKSIGKMVMLGSALGAYIFIRKN